MKQLEIADLFDQIAELLELQGENRFRIQAYARAALNLRNLSGDLEERIREGTLEEIPGVGKDLAGKIREAAETGRLKFLERLKKQIPAGMLQIRQVPGVGPKTAKLIHDRFRVGSLKELETLVRAGKLKALPGFKEKKAENILRGIALLRSGRERMPLGVAAGIGREMVEKLSELREVRRISVAGSLRRGKETVRDIDILVVSAAPEKVMDRFVKLPSVSRVQAHGKTKSSVRTRQGIQVDLRVVEAKSFGAALVYFTGSKAHNIKIRSLASRKGLTINEYGVFRARGDRRLAGEEEQEVYGVLGLPWIPPELREDWGEVEAAAKGKLPRLLERKDLKGSFHNHTDRTDGSHTLEEVARAVRREGYAYMVLSDHSKSLRVAGGLSEAELRRQMKQVERLNWKLKPFRILTGSEVDILPDGRLDYPDRLLAELDVVIAAVHSAFKQSREEMTRRVVRAVSHPHVDVLAHPTGRLLGEREPYAVDVEAVFRAAASAGTALELNCHTRRLDLNASQAKRAREAGAPLVLSTDTHVLTQLADIDLGLAQARRAWVGPRDVLNSLSADALLNRLRGKRNGKSKRSRSR